MDLFHFGHNLSEQTHSMESIIFCETSERVASIIVFVCLILLHKPKSNEVSQTQDISLREIVGLLF